MKKEQLSYITILMNTVSIIHKILTVTVLFRTILLARLSLLLWEVKGITTAEDCTDKMERRVSETGKLRQQLITNPFTSQECTSEETHSHHKNVPLKRLLPYAPSTQWSL